jgi:hypothetical protein
MPKQELRADLTPCSGPPRSVGITRCVDRQSQGKQTAMKGQWIGDYTGSSAGRIILNIDERSSYFQGVAYLNEADPRIPSTAISFRTSDKDRDFHFSTNQISSINPYTGLPESWGNVRRLYPCISVSRSLDAEGSCNADTLSLSWKTDIGGSGTCTLPRSMADESSELAPEEMEWESFKSHVTTREERRYLFRGQNGTWRLRTSFHRAGRADLTRFLNEDIQALHRHLSARTRHVFNLEIPNENGAFFNLVQHHGYPTPLLDWTYSPYVAAFFAYRGISKEKVAKADAADKVRILVLDQAQWTSDLQQIPNLLVAILHVSIQEFIAIENERMIPQQAASTVTNIDDIESYVKSLELQSGKKYLYAIDLPIQDREKVVQELRYMGITAGSMFPGLDGACEELKERNFEI